MTEPTDDANAETEESHDETEESHDETDVPEALKRDTADGKGGAVVPKSDFESFASGRDSADLSSEDDD